MAMEFGMFHQFPVVPGGSETDAFEQAFAQVDAAMLVETLVLDRDDRLLDQRRDVLRGDDQAALAAHEPREHPVVVARVDEPVTGDRLLPRRVERGDLARDGDDEAERERGKAQHPEKGEEGEEADLPDPARALPRRALASSSQRQNRPIVAPGVGLDSFPSWASPS